MELVEVKIDQSNFVHVYPQNSLLWSIIRPYIFFFSFREKNTPNQPNYLFDFPNIGSKIKIGVDLSVTYQNQLGEK